MKDSFLQVEGHEIKEGAWDLWSLRAGRTTPLSYLSPCILGSKDTLTSPEPGSQGGGRGLHTVYGIPTVLVNAANGQHVTGLPVIQCMGAALLHQACFSDSFCSAALGGYCLSASGHLPPVWSAGRARLPFQIWPPPRSNPTGSGGWWALHGGHEVQITARLPVDHMPPSSPRPLGIKSEFL